MMKKIEKKRMKILIAYDGSECSDAALEDLKLAGLPHHAEALILSVADAWVPDDIAKNLIRGQEDKAARKFVQKAGRKIKEFFPGWQVSAEAPSGSSASVILQRADEWKADLIVLGSHGRSALGRMRWGSVSQSIATHARCSVRISRRHRRSKNLKILVGLDGSAHSKVTLDKVASRLWPAETEIKVLAVFDPAYSTGVVIDPNAEYRYQWLTKAVKSAEKKLTEAGLHASGIVRGGNPRRVLIRKAQKWGADCIFVGSKGHSKVKHLLFGSVSSGVTMRAHCSVEIVRS